MPTPIPSITEEFEGGSLGVALSTGNTSFPHVVNTGGAGVVFTAGGSSGQSGTPAPAGAGEYNYGDFYTTDDADSTHEVMAVDWTARVKVLFHDTYGGTDAGYFTHIVNTAEVGKTPADWGSGASDGPRFKYDAGTKKVYFNGPAGNSTKIDISGHLDEWLDLIITSTVADSATYSYEIRDSDAVVLDSGSQTGTGDLYLVQVRLSPYADGDEGFYYGFDDLYAGPTADDPFAAPPSDVTITGTTSVAIAEVVGGEIPTFETVELIIADPAQLRAPTSLQVMLNGAESGEDVDFTIDARSEVVWTATTDDNGSLFLVSVNIPPTIGDPDAGGLDLDAGTHTLHAETASGKTASADFTLALDITPREFIQVPDVDPVEVPGRGNSWALQDAKPGGLGSWVMVPSPTSMSEPELTKTFDVDHTTNPHDGRYHISVGDDGAKEWTWSGYCPDQDFYEHLEAYAALNRRFFVIDHRARAWKVTISLFDPKLRKRQINDDGTPQDWAADYQVTAVVYDVDPLVPVAP